MIRVGRVTVTVTLGITLCSVILQIDARAAEVKLLSAAVMKPALGELAGAVRNRIVAGETVDVAIIQRPEAEALVQQGKIRSDSTVTMARSGVGVAAPKGAARPDISSAEALKQSLLAAKSITYPDPAVGAASGTHFRGVLERLGITEQVNAKAPNFLRTRSWNLRLLGGHADIAITQPMDILATPGYDLVGWLPPELQDYDRFTWAAGATANAKEPNAAEALVLFLSSRTAAAIIKRKGMERNISQ